MLRAPRSHVVGKAEKLIYLRVNGEKENVIEAGLAKLDPDLVRFRGEIKSAKKYAARLWVNEATF